MQAEEASTVLGVTLAAVVIVSVIGIGWLYVALGPLGDTLERGFLGPPDQRQRVEVADRRFAISFADDWLVEMEPQRLATDESRVAPVLVAGPDFGGPRCRVDAVPDTGATGAESFLLSWAADRDPDSEVAISTAPGLLEGVIGMSMLGADGTHAAAYWIPLADDALLLSCEVDMVADRPPGDDILSSNAQAMVLWGVPPIVESVEMLPSATPGPTDATIGRGERVETRGGLAVTLPEGWATLPVESDDDPGTLLLALGRMLPVRVPPSLTVFGPRLDDGEGPVETCTLGGAVLADYMRSWDDATLELIVDLVDWMVTNGALTGAESEAGSATYLDLAAGRVARLDSSDDVSYRSVYVLPRGKTLHLLVCQAPERAVDVWDSLAQSFELTPFSAG